MAQRMCRLCLGTENLLWVFGSSMVDNMAEIIHTTSGVEISQSDKVTQMVCSTCCQITIKMYKFRMTSMKNDRDLKAKYVCPNTVPTSSTSVTSKKEAGPSNKVTAAPCTKVGPINYKLAHPSVRKAVHENPGVIIPTKCLQSHIGAYITLLTDEVDEWYKERNYSDAEIAKLKRQAYESAIKEENVAKKRKLDPKGKNTKKNSSAESSKRNGRLSVDSESSRPGSACSNSTNKSCEQTKGRSAVGVKMDVRFARDNLQTLVSSADEKIHLEKSGTTCDKNQVAGCNRTETDVSVEVLRKKLNVKCDRKKDVASLQNPVSDPKKKEGLQNSTVKSSNQVVLKDSIAQSGATPKEPKQIDKLKDQITLTTILRSDESNKNKNENSAILQIDSSRPNTSMKPIENQKKSSLTKEDPHLPAPTEFTNYTWIVLSDSEDTEKEENSSDSDPIVRDIDSGSTSNDSTKLPENTDKATFTEALDLVPTNSNMPDLSLVSLVSKSHKLYTCKVCDSQKSSLKELKIHQRKTHTKCPFCSKRFRTLAHRDEHVRTKCRINKSPVKLKVPKLQLVRIDEDEEIKKKYFTAFQTEKDNKKDDKVEKDKDKEDKNAAEKESDSDDDLDGRLVICDPVTVKAISELENFINETEVISDRQTPKAMNNEQSDNNNDDVICISDEEPEMPELRHDPPTQSSNKMIDVINNELLKKIKIHDTDVNILKRILSLPKTTADKKTDTPPPDNPIEDNPIVNGNTNRVKIFKNLRKHLNKYKIPIQVHHGPTVSVEYKPTKAPPAKKLNDLWFTTTPQELRPLAKPPAPPAPNNLTYTLFNAPAVVTTSSQLINNVPQKFIARPITTMAVRPVTTMAARPVTTMAARPVTTMASTSILLNRTQNICTSTTNNKITNIILLPPNLVSLSTTTQGAFPVISHAKTVNGRSDQPTAATIDTLRSITDALMPPSRVSFNSEKAKEQSISKENTVQPAIRVKNLQELS
ncbi:uncharacterized protein LOC107398245 isoform X1 [Tribolium castaneum]|nr:PREDICTED: uncharacterized protein LOC107398245 isoform X1 [Tribolium castaneum]XP_015837147.1 PREDICTED: uncharacterized protein LOC107398245 isoform X2 [Tribolium castaneum]|eukprot:XP_015837146.1 PREDICTED: uncharacterized protein LOC107398245 isoform X1 [Tribolium castaneum]